MKILVLMPVYDTHEDITYAIYSKMPHEVKEKVFGMNMYATYFFSWEVSCKTEYLMMISFELKCSLTHLQSMLFKSLSFFAKLVS